MKNIIFTILGLLLVTVQTFAQFTPVGSGGYTNNFPGVDAANRNAYPGGQPQLSGNALGKPVPTNDWWSSLLNNDHVSNLFNYPMALRTTNDGLVVSYIVPADGANGSSQPMDDMKPIVVGVSGLNASKATVSDYSDWTVTMNWTNSTHSFDATAGVAMPFIYFNKNSGDVAQVQINSGNVVVSGEMIVVTDAHQGADFAIYAPAGSTWTENGTVYTSTLNGKDYWSIAFLPETATNVQSVADEYKSHAYVFPTDTKVDWSYNESTAKLSTIFTVETEVKEGAGTEAIIGLLPHQWAHLSAGSAQPNSYSFSSIRGEVKTLKGNSFVVENTFQGILPTLPYLANYSETFSAGDLDAKVRQLENDGLAEWTDSYNEGQVMNRLIQTARIADQMGNIESRDKMIETIQERLEDWLKAEAGEVAFLFYYNSDWTTLIGYPAGHGQDGNINDHHFHWGYFIHAAAFLEQFKPGWANQWGDMVNMLVRDASSYDRNDDKFPFLRNFSPYAGHCWANGFASFPFGNDQESSSESMQFHSSLIHWGTVTGNDVIRDLGIYLYTTEQTAAEEYWFDMNERTFKPGYGHSIASRMWGNGYDNQTFWTGDIAAVYGIEMYPIHGGSLYLGQNTAYVQKLWGEITQNTGILNNEENPNLWHDVMWEFLAFIDPETAIDLYNSYPDRNLKFGISDAQTYYWLHAMNAIGRVSNITADYPIAAVFDKNGTKTYVAHNYSSTDITVTFSDGYELQVPANQMATSADVDVSGVISTDFNQAYANGSVNLKVEASGNGVNKVEFFDGNKLVDTKTTTPYTTKASGLSLGYHNFYAKIYAGEKFNVTNIISVQVGEQIPFGAEPFAIPGVLEAGHFDKFQGGIGQGITYADVSPYNEGGYRPDEYVDAAADASEGATVGWISASEWLEYTVEVQQSGMYELAFRYASGTTNGGGPFHLEIDGEKISADISVSSTGDWGAWSSKTVGSIPMRKGTHVLRVAINGDGFNLGRMTFSRTGDLSYTPPVAEAGENVKVLLPATTANLDASKSTVETGKTPTYNWEQVYGSSIIDFATPTNATTQVSNLEEGVYKCKLTVTDGTYSAYDYVLIIVSSTANTAPSVSITSPANDASFYEGSDIDIVAVASDLDGTIAKVEFFAGTTKLGEATASPYSYSWSGATVGAHELTAKATDNGGETTTSDVVTVQVNSAPSCSGGLASGDYTYEFSDDKNNPTLTFIPGEAGTGSPTCILYYGTSEPFAGYPVTPGVPYPINASEGTRISFYYTYSFNGFEKNTAAEKHSYVIGTCSSTAVDFLDVSTNSLSVASAASSQVTFDISSNVSWTVSSDQTWLSTNKTTGSGSTTVTLTATENTAMSTRQAEISVSGDGFSETITVTQSAAGETLAVSTNTLSVANAANSQTNFSISSNIAWTVSSNQTWLTADQTSGTGDATIVLTATENSVTTTREAEVTISGGAFSETITVTQAAAIISGIDDNQKIKMLVYPNPATEVLNLRNIEQGAVISVFDLNGKMKQQERSTSPSFNMNVRMLDNGVYLLRVVTSEGVLHSKFVKE